MAHEYEGNMINEFEVPDDLVTIDIEQEFWKQIKQAAEDSSWIPKDHYYMNDWVADVCKFLREGN